MLLVIDSYEKHLDCFKCRDEQNDIRYIDLFTDQSPCECRPAEGLSKEKYDAYCESLVGYTIEVDEFYSYIEFASGVRIIGESSS